MHINEPGSEVQRDASLRGFWNLFVTQFQGAFSDNVLKNLVVFMTLGVGLSQAQEHQFAEEVGALFTLPFILFSMAGGFLADRFSKRSITIGVKVFEVFVMLLALVALTKQHRHLLLVCIFLMGTHSAFFGPSKYGLLPELLPEKKLSWGNGLLELGTFTAIILGTVLASAMGERLHGRHVWSGVILIGLAFVGLATSLGISRVPAADPTKRFQINFVADLWNRLKAIRGDRPLVLAVLGNMYFTFIGQLVLLNLFFYGHGVLHLNKIEIGYLNAALALGIGFGSVAAGYLSGGKIEYGLVPLGAMGLAVFSASLAIPGATFIGALVMLAFLGLSGGFFIVPVSALLQHRPDKTRKGELLAAANLLSFVGAFIASGAHYLFAQVLNLSPLEIFLVGGVMTFAGSVYAVTLLPDALLRFVLWVLTRTIYGFAWTAGTTFPPKAVHCSCAIICRWLMRCSCWRRRTGKFDSSC